MSAGRVERSTIWMTLPLLFSIKATEEKLAFTLSGNLNMAPVIGSTIKRPTGPPNKMFPKYQPLILAVRGIICCGESFLEKITSYLAGVKKPDEAGSVTIEGVAPSWTIIPFCLTCTFAPDGELLKQTGYSDLEIIDAQLVIKIALTAVNVVFSILVFIYFLFS